jgi:exosortase
MKFSLNQRWILLSTVVVLIHFHFLWQWGHWMWGREHYQFFPMILAGFGWLAWQTTAEIRWPSIPACSMRAWVYLVASASAYALAAFTGSHWIGLISCLMSLWTVTWFLGGVFAADLLRGPMLFLALLIPLPINLDLQLIVSLQKFATWFASGGLDLAGIRHTVSGVAIRTALKAYMVEEACSGIHSLFSAVSAMIFFGVYCRYGVPRLVLTLVQTLFWVVAANAFRVFLIVYADSRFQIQLDTGWRHDMLGFAIYGLVLVSALSFDQLLRFLFPMSRGAVISAREELDEVILKPFRMFVDEVIDRPRLKGRQAVILPIAAALLVYLPSVGVAVVRQWKSSSVPTGQSIEAVGAVTQFKEDSLSTSAGAFTKAGFESISRDPSDPFGMSSSIWQFAGHGLSASVSVDGMYSEFHDLAYCYTGSGWKLEAAENGFLMQNGLAIPHTRMKLYKNSGEQAVVYFSCFDSMRKPVDPPDVSGSILRTLKNRLVSGGLLGTPKAPIVPPVFQVQLMVASGKELLPHELSVLEQLFNDTRAQILTQLSAGQ